MKTRKWSYLAHIRSKMKMLDSIIINSKSWRKQSIFIFLFRVKLSELGPFLEFWRFLASKEMFKTKNWPYLPHFDSKCKNKGTLSPQACKSEGNKVPSFLHFELRWKRYGQFLVWTNFWLAKNLQKSKNGPNLLSLTQNKKIKILCFLQLLELIMILLNIFSFDLIWAR